MLTLGHRQKWTTLFVLFLSVACGPAHRPPAAPPAVIIESGGGSTTRLTIPADAPDTESNTEAMADLLETGGLRLLPAARFALTNNHSVRIARKQYAIAGGTHQLAGGQFNWNWSHSYDVSREHEPFTETEKAFYRARGRDENFAKFDLSTYTTELRKPTRSGPSFTQRLTVTHTDDVVQNTDARNKAEMEFTVDVPVLRGRGAVSASANERSAAVLAEAAGLDLVHQSAAIILDVTNLYYSYLESERRRKTAEASEGRARVLLEETRLLVEAGQQPRASLKQLEANLEDKKATRLARTLSVVNARNALGIALGLSVEKFPQLPVPADRFPAPSMDAVDKLSVLADRLSRDALERRQDFMALQKRVGSANILLKAARRDLLPLLNVYVGTGYEGLHEGGGREDMYRGVNSNVTDPEWKAGFILGLPLGNDAAKGRFKQRLGQYQQTRIQSSQLAARIQSNVVTAIAAIQSTTAELSAGINAFDSYRQALADEEEKFRLGLATSLDVINVEDRLSQADERVTSARSQLAKAIVNLRFAAGRIVEPADGVYRVRRDTLGSLAFLDLLPPAKGSDASADTGE